MERNRPDTLFKFILNAVSYSLRRSSSQNQNRTGALRLVDNFGAPLCRVLILHRASCIFSVKLIQQRNLFCLQGKRGFLPFPKHYAIFSMTDLDLWRGTG